MKTIGVGGQELVLKGERKIDNKRNEKGNRRSEKMRDRKIVSKDTWIKVYIARFNFVHIIRI